MKTFREWLKEKDYYESTQKAVKDYLNSKVHITHEIGMDLAIFLLLGDKVLEKKFIKDVSSPDVDQKKLSQLYSDTLRKIMKYTPKDRQEARNTINIINKKLNSSAMRSLEDLINGDNK